MRGFTVVELLIAVVIIAILAVVTVVTFNGVQKRADNTRTLAAIDTYVKALTMFATNNNRYPINAAYPCLGPAGTTCGATAGCFGYGSATSNSTFINDITSVLSNMPQLSDKSIKCTETGMAKGGFYYSADGISVTVQYFLRGDAACNPPSGLTIYARYQSEDATDCRGTMLAP